MSLVPVIDIGPAADGARGRRAVAMAIARACEEIGFFAIVGHGVSSSTLDAMWHASRDFFDLAIDERLAVKAPYPGYPYGYTPYLAEGLAYSLGDETPPDLKETYSMGPLDRPALTSPDPDEAFAYAANIWPRRPPQFRQAWEAYYDAMGALAHRLMRLFAIALDLDEAYFDGMIDRHISGLRAANYPHPDSLPKPGQLRAGAHADYGSLTILLQDDAPGGLQVQTADGRWHPVPAIPDAFVINLGDLMARWTNDRWVSTMHRVVNPPPDAAGSTRRQSIAFFHTPNWDAPIACIETCLAPGDRPKYPVVRAGAHLVAKYRRTVEFTSEAPPDRDVSR